MAHERMFHCPRCGTRYKLDRSGSRTSRGYWSFIFNEDKLVLCDRGGHNDRFEQDWENKKGRYVVVQAVIYGQYCVSHSLEFGPHVCGGIRTLELVIDDSLQRILPDQSPRFSEGFRVGLSVQKRQLMFQRMQEKPITVSRAQKKIVRDRLIGDIPLALEGADPSVKIFFAELGPSQVPAIHEEVGYRIDLADYSRKDSFIVSYLMKGGIPYDGVILNGRGELHASMVELAGSPTIEMSYQFDDARAVPMRLTAMGMVAPLDTTILVDGEHKLTLKAVDRQHRQATKSIKIVVKNKS